MSCRSTKYCATLMPALEASPIRYAISRSDGTYKICKSLLVVAGCDCDSDCDVEDISKDEHDEDDEDDAFLPLAIPTTAVKAFTFTVVDKELQNNIAVAVKVAAVQNAFESVIVTNKQSVAEYEQ